MSSAIVPFNIVMLIVTDSQQNDKEEKASVHIWYWFLLVWVDKLNWWCFNCCMFKCIYRSKIEQNGLKWVMIHDSWIRWEIMKYVHKDMGTKRWKWDNICWLDVEIKQRETIACEVGDFSEFPSLILFHQYMYEKKFLEVHITHEEIQWFDYLMHQC